MLRATVRRKRVSLRRSMGPKRAKSGSSGAAFSLGPPERDSRAKRFTSASEMRPPGPLPSTCCTSTPTSRANLRTDGAAKAPVGLLAAAGAGAAAATGLGGAAGSSSTGAGGAVDVGSGSGAGVGAGASACGATAGAWPVATVSLNVRMTWPG